MSQPIDNGHLRIVLLEIEQDAMKFLHSGTQVLTYVTQTEQVAAVFEAISQDAALANKEETV